MKSVSFSDLRNSSIMLNKSDQVNNCGDSLIKRSSSYKNLTYYSSSEDILRRFSSKTVELKNLKDGYKSDDTNGAIQLETYSNEKIEDKTVDMKSTNSGVTIQDLKALILEQEKTISILQEKNLFLQNESSKNVEEIKFQENRINYLEHMLAAFNTNLQENKIIYEQSKDSNFVFENSASDAMQYKSKERVSFHRNDRIDSDKSNSFQYQKSFKNNNELVTDLNTRPSSADSTLQSEYKYNNDILNKNNQAKYKESIRTYTSDTEERLNSSATNTIGRNKKNSVNEYVPKPRTQIERERSSDLYDMKNRLDEFTKYAKRTIKQNNFTQLCSSTPINYENKRLNKYSSFADTDTQYKSRAKCMISTNDSRPPIDPYYKQRRQVTNEVKLTHDRPIYPKNQDFTDEDDENLKERVQKILEKHKYPSQIYGEEDNRKNSDNSYQSGNDNFNISNLRKFERESSDYKYTFQHKDITDNNESIIPRNSTTANDLIAKYLNYQGSSDVSY